MIIECLGFHLFKRFFRFINQIVLICSENKGRAEWGETAAFSCLDWNAEVIKN